MLTLIGSDWTTPVSKMDQTGLNWIFHIPNNEAITIYYILPSG